MLILNKTSIFIKNIQNYSQMGTTSMGSLGMQSGKMHTPVFSKNTKNKIQVTLHNDQRELQK